LKKWLLAPMLLMCVFAAGSAYAGITIHYAGFGYEEGGFDYSAPGDTLWFIAEVTGVTTDGGYLPYEPGTYEYTMVAGPFISNGEIVEGTYTTIVYNLGYYWIYQDAAFNADWDEYPYVSDPPSTFLDGDLWLGGPFTDFIFYVFRDLAMGSFDGHITLSEGIAFPYLSEQAYTFGGTLHPPHSGVDPPPGYEFYIDGETWVPVEVTTWGAVKALY